MKLVFNIGGTKTRMGISKTDDSLEKVEIFATEADFSQQVSNMKNIADNWLNKGKWEKIIGGIPGVFNPAKTELSASPNLAKWINISIKKKLEEELKAPVILENDALLEALGEATLGAGRRKQKIAYLTIGTGIGGALIIDGKPVPTSQGFEPGHQIIFADEKIGYWQDLASGSAMKKIYGKDPKDIVQASIWEDETRLLAIGINNLIVLWSPEAVILGGGLMNNINIEKLTGIIREQLTIFPKCPDIIKAELGDKSGLYGALTFG